MGCGGRLLTFSIFRVGAYSMRALIRGWALIRINTVSMALASRADLSGAGTRDEPLRTSAWEASMTPMYKVYK